jgi:hypothetical protein
MVIPSIDKMTFFAHLVQKYVKPNIYKHFFLFFLFFSLGAMVRG